MILVKTSRHFTEITNTRGITRKLEKVKKLKSGHKPEHLSPYYFQIKGSRLKFSKIL